LGRDAAAARPIRSASGPYARAIGLNLFFRGSESCRAERSTTSTTSRSSSSGTMAARRVCARASPIASGSSRTSSNGVRVLLPLRGACACDRSTRPACTGFDENRVVPAQKSAEDSVDLPRSRVYKATATARRKGGDVPPHRSRSYGRSRYRDPLRRRRVRQLLCAGPAASQEPNTAFDQRDRARAEPAHGEHRHLAGEAAAICVPVASL
jgi:hypothetical protein